MVLIKLISLRFPPDIKKKMDYLHSMLGHPLYLEYSTPVRVPLEERKFTCSLWREKLAPPCTIVKPKPGLKTYHFLDALGKSTSSP
jgi:hypothetical protein